MFRWTTRITMVVLLLAGGFTSASAQTNLVPGGLTALPAVSLGSDLLQNGGFETLSGGLPTGWSAPSGWATDQQVTHSGSASYRRDGNAATSSQFVQLKKGIYNLTGWVKTQNLGNANAGVRLQFNLRPVVNNWTTTDVISGTTDWTFYELKNLIVPADQKVEIQLENFAGGAGTAWFDDLKLVQQLPQPLDVFLLYPNYRGMLFDDQPQTMRFDITVTPPGGDFGRFKVAGALKDEASGQVIASQTYAASANFVAELDGSGMQAGKGYLVTFALVEAANGATNYAYPAYRVSKAPGAARQNMNISFDAKNRILFKGKPRFVLGAYDSGGGYSAADSFWENQIWSPTGDRRLEGLRINMYLNYWMGEAPADAMKAQMANLQKRGVMYLQTGNCFAKWPSGPNFGINNSDAYVQDIGAHPGSAGYYTADECLSEHIPGTFDQYKRLRSLDPDSMTFAALLGADDVRLWRDAADVLSTDPYPLFAAEPSGGYNHKVVADWTALTRDAVKDARPYMTVLQFFKFTGAGRWPARQEMRNHAYMAIVEGAKGLWWWSVGNGDGALATVCTDWCAERTAHLDDLKAVVGELADLEPVLIADDSPGALTGNSNSSAIRTKVKVVGGKGYLFAYNYTTQTVNATFTWQIAPGTITVNAEGRTLSANGNNFSDSFGPYQAHVYVIANGGNAGGGTTPPPPPPSNGALTVGFTNPPADTTVGGKVTVTVSASGGSGSGFNYKVDADGTSIFSGTNNSFTWDTATVANGAHTLTANVTDSGSGSGTGTVKVTVSNQASPPPSTPPPSSPPSGTLTVTFTSPNEGEVVSNGVVTNLWVGGQSGTSNAFSLAVDGQVVQTQTIAGNHATLVWDSTKFADGQHTMTATVKDATGQTGSRTRTVTTKNGTASAPPPPSTPPPSTPPPSTPPPSTPPAGSLTVTFTSPSEGEVVSKGVVTNLWVGGQSGTSNAFSLAVDGQVVQTQTISSIHATLVWDSTKFADGQHTLTATVKDATGQTGSRTRTVTINNGTASAPPPPSTPPPTTPPPSTPPPSTPPAGSLTVTFTSPGEGEVVSKAVVTNIWVGGQSGTSNAFSLAVDGQVVQTQTIGDNHATFVWDSTKFADGQHTLTATVKDAAGKTGTRTRNVTIKNAGGTLQVSFTSPTPGQVVSGNVAVNLWVAGQNGLSNTFTLSADGQVVTSQTIFGVHATLNWPTTGITNGTHTLMGTVKDAAGNTGSVSLTVTVRN